MRGLDSPWGLRVTGLVGVAVVAAGAYGAGALPGRDPGAGLRGAGTPGVGFWLGLAGWVVGLTILSTAWWRLGKRLSAVSSRWLIGTGALWALPLLLAPPLASRDVYSYACQGQIWNSGLDPYAVGAADGGCSWAGSVPDLWLHTPAPYGPVGVALSGAAAAVGRAVGGPAGHQLLAAVTVLRIVALIGGVLIAIYAGRLATAAGIAPTAARWLALLSPLVAVHLVSGAHNDALTAGLTVAALAVATSANASRRTNGGQSPTDHPAPIEDGSSGPPSHDAAAGARSEGLVAGLRSQGLVIGPPSQDAVIGPQSQGLAADPPSQDVAVGPQSQGLAAGPPSRDAAVGPQSQSLVIDPPSHGRVEGLPSHGPAQGSRPLGLAEGPPWRAAIAAGTFIGLAVAVKVTAIIALPFVILLVAGWRTKRRPTTAITAAAITVTATGALVFAAASLATGLDLGWFGALSDTGSLVQWTSLPTGIGMAVGYLLRAAGWPGAADTAVYAARICGVVALAVIAAALGWRALQATLRGLRDNEPPDRAATSADTAPAGNDEVIAPSVAIPLADPGPTPVRATDVSTAGHDRPHQAALASYDQPKPAATHDQANATAHRRQVIAAAGWTLAAAAILLPVFYPWYAIAPLAVLACATPPGRTRTALAATAIAITALIIPNGLGLAVLTKLPGAFLDVAIVAALIYRFRSHRSSQDDPVPAAGER
ncbi:uncharacterized protein DUF2029 [Asanoa ferruginea]|uniref:Uncharacterized protein DUF2029 n=1 Tax=Asanoa ferruginea TaxID=53367 RepID=A0A3D9ZYF3_9ACTN|nr:polyprenol phosphomannose-dependent alpha 1,6 mannosyltransferase MptB [Asanoa ferruginea]REG02146.1 uncharacterized protein DUF2029 [Asanoa ferruginea]GIF48557.1 hypothetical protein Afe04nite_30960 [Asanoa ferruginea]